MSDMSMVIVPKSDQINADDLLSGPITIQITGVKVTPGTEQPVAISFAGSNKAFRPCKSMARVLVSAWGPDSSKYVGRSLTLYCDPKVKWGGMEVGGIRISHMSDINSQITMALTMTRANKKPFTVKPLQNTAASGKTSASSLPSSLPVEGVGADAADQMIHSIEACDTEAELRAKFSEKWKAADGNDALQSRLKAAYDKRKDGINQKVGEL